MYYTKYRPQKFSEISKPNNVAEALMKQIQGNKAVHAYLFIGPRGTGKTTTARILAKALNCENVSEKGDPCGKCNLCFAISNGSFLDLIEIDAASNRGIDDIRDLRNKIKLAPTTGRMKVYIIDEVHMLTTEAFNALLKTLEEPPAHSTFILCTTEEHKVPDTIKSRCQVFKFKRATIPQLVAKLKGICDAEKVKVSEEDLKKLARASFGGFRDAETLLQQVVEGSLDVDSFLGTTNRENYMEFLEYLQSSDTTGALHKINNMYEDGIDLHVWAMEFVKYMRDLLFISSGAHEGLLDVTEDVFARMEEQACKFEPVELVRLIEIFVKAHNSIKSAALPQLPLELAVVTVCAPQASSDAELVSKKPGGDPSAGDKPKGSKTTSKKPSTSSSAKFSVDDINSKWSEILKGTIEYNHSIQALLKAAKPVEVSGNTIILEVFYSFHKERLESAKNRSIVEGVVRDKMGDSDLTIRCVLSENKPKPKSGKETGELTDFNVSVPSSTGDMSLEGNLLEVFDGALPL